jgi:hypothetical protein
MLEVAIERLTVTLKAWVVLVLCVSMILETPFVGDFVNLIFPREKRVVLWDPKTQERMLEMLYTGKPDAKAPERDNWVKSAADLCVTPLTEMRIDVRSGRAGLSVVRPKQRCRCNVVLENGLVDKLPEGLWSVWVASVSENPVMVSRGQVLGVALEPPATFFSLKQSAGATKPFTEDPPMDLELEVA